jgi:ribosomal protein S18 acetylase RimI-like enzyme
MIMNYCDIRYRKNSASCESIIGHLNKCGNDFNPPLYTYVNIEQYAIKIRDNAVTFEAWDENELVGLVAVYFNNLITRVGYITSVSVIEERQRAGIATNLMRKAIEFGKKKDFKELRLELNINNSSAIKLYKKSGFVFNGTNNDRIIMSCLL